VGEVDEWAWLRLGDARGRLSYEGDVELLDALEALAVPVSSAVLVVRHGSAGDPELWEGDDHLRPLDRKGRRQAEALRRALPAFAPTRLLSVACARCLQTLAPLAADLGVELGLEPSVSETEYARAPEVGLRRIIELASAGGTTAVCSQGTVIPHLIATISGTCGPDMSQLGAKKGSVWALSFTAGNFVAADYYPTLVGWPRLV
jgi:8-oxo-dGTP diphosphatase